jgi:TATA-binding protein-associated factor Taf7
MKRPVKSKDGLYHIKGKTYKCIRGSRAQVWNGTAYKTEGGLHKSGLVKSHGRIVSALKHKTAKKEMRLQKYGFFAKKGKFGYVKKSVKRNKSKRKTKRRKYRGGKDEEEDDDDDEEEEEEEEENEEEEEENEEEEDDYE